MELVPTSNTPQPQAQAQAPLGARTIANTTEASFVGVEFSLFIFKGLKQLPEDRICGTRFKQWEKPIAGQIGTGEQLAYDGVGGTMCVCTMP